MSLIRKRKFYLSSLIVAVVALLATVILWPGINVSASNTYLSIEVGLNTDQQIRDEHSSVLDIKFNPTGTHVDSKGNLKIRLDFYPTPESKSYDQYHVYIVDTASKEYLAGYQGKADPDGNPADPVAYQKWLDGLPHIWQLNPCLCAFVTVPSSVTKETLDQYVKNTYTDAVTATIDDCMIQANSSHLISPYMKDKVSVFSTKTEEETAKSANLAKTESQKVALSESINTTLKDYAVTAKSASGLIEKVEPRSIDVGTQPSTRSGYTSAYRTFVNRENPANADGVIDTVVIWVETDCTAKAATFIEGASYSASTHDYESLGSITQGSYQTITGLTIDCSTGDKIGAYAYGQCRKYDTTCTENYMYITADAIPCSNETFTKPYGTNALCLYGTGTEGGGLDVGVSPTSKAFGTVATSSTYYAKGSAPSNPVADGDCTFTITNTGDACDLNLKVADFTGGTGWNIVSTSPGTDEARITAYYSGQNPANGLVLSNSDQEFYDGLAASGTLKFDFKLETGSSFSFGNQVSTNITVTAVAED